jgi:hypothetical protein
MSLPTPPYLWLALTSLPGRRISLCIYVPAHPSICLAAPLQEVELVVDGLRLFSFRILYTLCIFLALTYKSTKNSNVMKKEEANFQCRL